MLLRQRGSLAAFLEILLQTLHALFDRSDIREHQFVIEIAAIAFRIDGAFRMRHRFVLECTNHVDQHIHRAQRRKCHILAASANQCRDIHEFHHRVGGFFGLEHGRKKVQPGVRDLDEAMFGSCRREPESAPEAFPWVRIWKIVDLPEPCSPMIPAFIEARTLAHNLFKNLGSRTAKFIFVDTSMGTSLDLGGPEWKLYGLILFKFGESEGI